MAKKKQEDPPVGAPAWMATFSDLMNLLLCFFVLLFAMSSVDANKWEQLVASFTNNLNIWSGGSSSIGEGMMVGMGTSQLSELDEYFNTMGQSADETEGEEAKEKQTLKEQYEEASRNETKNMLDQISEKSEQPELSKQLEISMDDRGQYVELLISGEVLFESGSAFIREEAKVIMSKIGDILSSYKKQMIEIIGYTDNVKINTTVFPSNKRLSSARAESAAEYFIQEKKLDENFMKWSGRGEYNPIASNATKEGRARNRRIEIRIYNSFNSD